MKRIYLAAIVALAAHAIAAAQLSTGVAVPLNDGWTFRLLSDPASPVQKDVTVPHDWSILMEPRPELNASTGFFPGGVGEYRRTLELVPADTAGRKYILFEGVYNRSQVWVNDSAVGGRPNGYVSFYFDVTDLLRPGRNEIRVVADHSREADSRWYTGSGIYRPVWLVSTADTHFAPWSLRWSTANVTDASADLSVAVDVMGDIRPGTTLTYTLTDPDGTTVPVPAKTTVANPRLWDIDSPQLYTLTATLASADGAVLDSASVPLGFRSLEFSPDSGMWLNGRNIKVKGVCIHHDAGVLGAAVPPEVWRRRLIELKKLGVNAVRLSHNPQAPALYDLCDELGLLVMDEASDEWEFPKRKWITGWNVGEPRFEGSYDFFEEWIDTDVADMVRRDRIHPSVAFWSIGNEVDYPNDPYSHPVLDSIKFNNQHSFGAYNPDAPDARRIGLIARRLADVVRAHDTGRPVTGALAGVVMSNHTEYPDAVDIVGYNYTEDRYAEDHAAYPARVIYGSENGHSLWAWEHVRDNPYIFGQFLWTGIDYLGESNPWPSRGLGTGLLDFGAFPKTRGKYRAALWRDDAPVVYLAGEKHRPGINFELNIDADEHWNYAPSDTVRVYVYTNRPDARLTLNGRPVGARRLKGTDFLIADVPWEAGELVATVDGAADTLYTTGAVTHLAVETLDRSDSLVQLLIEARDESGRRVPDADVAVGWDAVRGLFTAGVPVRQERAADLELIAIEGTGNTDMTAPRAAVRRLDRGRAVAYMRPRN